MEYRIEHDSMGEMKVPADRLWAAQTQRSHENFEIGVGIETMPAEIIHAFGYLKKAVANFAQTLYNRQTQRNIRHKNAVHNINMYPISPCQKNFINIVTQGGKICRQD